jgi:SPP1 family predicted phage head-tail adaptor
LVASSDSAGSYVETFTNYATVPALITCVDGRQTTVDAKTTSASTHHAYISYRADVTSTDRVFYGGRYFLIELAKNPFNQGKLLKLTLKMLPE